MLSLDELANLVEAGNIDTVIIAFSDHYGRLLGKRLDAEYFLAEAARAGTHACDYLLTTDMEMEPVPGYEFANWELGYGDFHLAPDLDSLRHATWLQKTAIVLCDVENEALHQPVSAAPRSILRRQLRASADLGYSVNAASELEYYIYRDSYRDAQKQSYADLEPMGWYLEDYHLLQGTREEGFTAAARHHLKHSGIPVESSKGEWGLGQHEINIRYADALSMADRHSLMKHCLKEIADAQGCSVTFMAKPHAGQAGSSCHIHLSLFSGGDNAFAGDAALGPVMGSDVFRHFLGGWMAHLPELMVFYAPTVNSYKRYEDGSWAPTRIAWSYDNRTAAFRVVGDGSSLRIECRAPGADCNPYLAYAAAHRLRPGRHPQSRSSRRTFSRAISTPPATCRACPIPWRRRLIISRKATSRAPPLALDVVGHYTHFFHSEVESFNSAVTDWERARYFERI